VVSIFFAILLEAGIGLVQHHTGYLRGFIKDKGRGGLREEPVVPGIETVERATGTLLDSHSYGLYLAMLLPYPFTYSFAPHVRRLRRFISILVFMIGGAALAISYSRSAWLSAALSLSAALAILSCSGGRRAVGIVLPALGALLLLVVFAANTILERLATAPKEIMTARFDQYKVAEDIWSRHLLFGCGAGNYLHVMRAYAGQSDETDAVVHNVFLWIGAEMGILGVVAFFGVILVALVRLLPLTVASQHRHHRVALCIVTAFLAYLLDGLTDPVFREPAVYMLLWYSLGMSVALRRLSSHEPAPTAQVAASRTTFLAREDHFCATLER
jgi:O-antigen ligase